MQVHSGPPEARRLRQRALLNPRAKPHPGARLGLAIACSFLLHAGLAGLLVRAIEAPRREAALEAFPVPPATIPTFRAPLPTTPASQHLQKGAADGGTRSPVTPDRWTALERDLPREPAPAALPLRREDASTAQEPQASSMSIAERRVEGRSADTRQGLPVPEALLRLWAEVLSNDALSPGSGTATAPGPLIGVLAMDWPPETRDIRVEVHAIWRASPERLDAPVQTVPLEVFGTPPDGAPPEIFYLRNLKPGAYTLVLHYRAGKSSSGVRPTLYLPDAETLSVRSLKPISLTGMGRVVLAKVLLPQGVLWEHDEWFTGQSESAEALTKFRFPEGISWAERKADLR